MSFRHNTKPRHCRPHDPPSVLRWVLLRRRGQRAPREVRDAIRHRRGMKKTRELNGVSARAMALCAVALCVTTLGAREAVQSKTVANFMLPEGHVWDMPATRVRERTRLKEKIERWAQLGVKVTVMDNETTSVSLDQGGAHGDNATDAEAQSIKERESRSSNVTALTPEETLAIAIRSTMCVKSCLDDAQVEKILDGQGCSVINGNGLGEHRKLTCVHERCDCAEAKAITETLLYTCDARKSGANFSYTDMMDFYDASIETAFDDCKASKEDDVLSNQLNAQWDADANRTLNGLDVTPVYSNSSSVAALGWCHLPGDARWPSNCAIPAVDNPSCSFNSGCGRGCPWGSILKGTWRCGWCCGWCWSWPCSCWCRCKWRRWGVRCRCGCRSCRACAKLPTFQFRCHRQKFLRRTGGCKSCIPGYVVRHGRCQLVGWIQDIINGINTAKRTIADAPKAISRAANDVKSAFDAIGSRIVDITRKAEDLAKNFAKKVSNLFDAIANSIIPTSPEAVVRGIEKAFTCGSSAADLGDEPEYITQPVHMGLLDPLNEENLHGMIQAIMRDEDISDYTWTTHRKVRNPHYTPTADLGGNTTADLGWCPPAFSAPKWPDFPDLNVNWGGIPWPPKTPTISMPGFPQVKLPRMPGLTFPGLPGWSPVCLLTQVCLAPKIDVSIENNRGMELDIAKKLHGTGIAEANFKMSLDTKYPISVCIRVQKVKIPFEVISESIKVIVQWMKKKLLVAFDAIKKWGQPIADAIDDAKDVVKDGIDEVTGWFRSIGIGRRLLDSEDITSEKEADEEVAYHERIAKEMESRQLALAARYLGRLEAAYATYAPEMESHVRLETQRMRNTVKSHPIFHHGHHHDAATLGIGLLDWEDKELTDGLRKAFLKMKNAAFVLAVGAAFDTKVTIAAEASAFMTGDFTNGGIVRTISQTFGGGSGFYTTLEGVVRITAPWMFMAESKGEFSYRIYHDGDIGFEVGLDDGEPHIKVHDPKVKAEPQGAFSASASFKTGLVFEIVDMKLQFCYDTKVCAGPQINVGQPIYLGADAFVAASMADTKCFAGGTELTAVFADTFDGYEDDANCKLRSGGSVAGVGGYVELPYPSINIVLQTIIDGNDQCVPDYELYDRPISGSVIEDVGGKSYFQKCTSSGSGSFFNEGDCECPVAGTC